MRPIADRLAVGWRLYLRRICRLARRRRARSAYFPLAIQNSINFDPAQVFRWMKDHIAAGVRFVTLNGIYDLGGRVAMAAS